MKIFSYRGWTLALCCLAATLAQGVYAQSGTGSSGSVATADYIVALVNSEPITNSELLVAIRRVVDQIQSQGQAIPPQATLRQGVLDRLIMDRVQLQLARESGLKVEDSAVNMAEANLAQQHQITIEALRAHYAAQGMSAQVLRAQLRDQIMLTRLRERDVDARVKVTEQDIDHYLAEQQEVNRDPMAQEVNLAQLLIAVPEHADATQVAALREQAGQLLRRLRAGEKFTDLVQQYSAADRSNGGQLGLRRAGRYPSIFVRATQDLPVGGFSEVVQSGAGFHILTVLERHAPSALQTSVVQTHARHILLRITPSLPQANALAQLADYRKRIVSGQDSFESLARHYSQDGSADHGGDLGWTNAGVFVPEFEEVLSHLKVGEISAPMVSRYGVHLIQLMDRRIAEISPKDAREAVRKQLLSSKLDEAYVNWARDIRDRAYIELRDPPQ